MISLTYNISNSRILTCKSEIPEEIKTNYTKDYCEKFNFLSKKISKSLKKITFSNKDGEYTINVILHDIELYKNPPTEDSRYYFWQDYFCKENRDNYLPILHFSTILFDDRIVGHRYSYIMDNSIWNYFVKIWKGNGNQICRIDEVAFANAIRNITNGIERELYKLCVTREYAELNARIMQQSYLVSFPKSIGHSDYVSPFIFHSEGEIEKFTEKEFINGSRNTIAEIKRQRWRILLVDDKANRAMAPFKPKTFNKNDNLRWDCKLKIIKYWLDSFFKKTDSEFIIRSNADDSYPNTDTHLLIEYKETLEEAKEALKAKEYDIILLDYLLLEPKNKVHYGYELLEDIYNFIVSKKLVNDISNEINNNQQIGHILENICSDNKYEELWKFIKSSPELKLAYDEVFSDIGKLSDKEQKWKILFGNIVSQLKRDEYKIGPQKQLFFMFISAYSSAVHDRLLAQGLNQSEKYWFINVGACPTNTPQLFLYNLIKLMEKRLDDSGVSKLSSDALYKLVNKIYLPKENDPKRESVRKRANAFYQDVLSLQYHYRNILKDVEIPFKDGASVFDTSGSVLMTDFIQKKVNLGGMLEHLTQLVHLTAFGTIRQWSEMWEEYIYFKALFEKQLDDVSIGDFNTLCQNLENYILELKSQQQ